MIQQDPGTITAVAHELATGLERLVAPVRRLAPAGADLLRHRRLARAHRLHALMDRLPAPDRAAIHAALPALSLLAGREHRALPTLYLSLGLLLAVVLACHRHLDVFAGGRHRDHDRLGGDDGYAGGTPGCAGGLWFVCFIGGGLASFVAGKLAAAPRD